MQTVLWNVQLSRPGHINPLDRWGGKSPGKAKITCCSNTPYQIYKNQCKTPQLPKQSGWAKRALRHWFLFPTHCHPTTHPPSPRLCLSLCISQLNRQKFPFTTFVASVTQKKSRKIPPPHSHLAIALYIIFLSRSPCGLEGCFGGVCVHIFAASIFAASILAT